VGAAHVVKTALDITLNNALDDIALSAGRLGWHSVPIAKLSNVLAMLVSGRGLKRFGISQAMQIWRA
jgi:hypothetical protein